jgi:hypothetical protein
MVVFGGCGQPPTPVEVTVLVRGCPGWPIQRFDKPENFVH